MKIGTLVTHISYPGQVGRVLAKTKRWSNAVPIILVKWDKSNHLSRHIPSALTEVKR
mgnify:FL=1